MAVRRHKTGLGGVLRAVDRQTKRHVFPFSDTLNIEKLAVFQNYMSIPAAAKYFVRLAVEKLSQPPNVQLLPNIRGVGDRPSQERAIMLKLVTVSIASLYLGGYIAHKGASYLEENEIFVPSDDDDDD